MVGIHQHVLSESQSIAGPVAQVSLSSSGPHATMPMYFTWSYDCTLLFSWWQTSAAQPSLYYLTLLAVFCLGMLQEWLHFKRIALSAEAADLYSASESAPLVSADRRVANETEAAQAVIVQRPPPILARHEPVVHKPAAADAKATHKAEAIGRAPVSNATHWAQQHRRAVIGKLHVDV